MKDMKITFSDTNRDFSGWVKEKSGKVLKNLCRTIKNNKEIINDEWFNDALDDALKIFALTCENLNGIYCDKVRTLLVKYNVDGYNFLCDMIYNRKDSKIMQQIYREERDEKILNLIEENVATNRTLIAELLSAFDHTNSWINQIADDIELVHNGEKNWQWFYEKHYNDRNTLELQFENEFIREIYDYFQSDDFKDADTIG